VKKYVKNALLIILGAWIYSIAINGLLIPHEIGEGGVTGLTTIGYYALNIPPALTNIVLNSILLIIGYRFLDKKTVLYSIWAVIWISVFLHAPKILDYQTEQTIIPTLAGGVLMGLALGLIFQGEGTIAGSTILAKIVNRYFGMRTGTAMLLFDFAVAVPSGFVIGFENMLLTILELYVSAIVFNGFHAYFGAKKSVTIITKKTDEVTEMLSNELKQGITLVSATGYYHQEARPIIYLICTDKQVARIFPMISEVDPAAFVVVDDVHSVKGEELTRIL